MPIIYALQGEEAHVTGLKSRLTKDVTEEDLAYIFDIVTESGALAKTKELAMRYNERAMALVGQLPSGETRSILEALIPSLLTRLL